MTEADAEKVVDLVSKVIRDEKRRISLKSIARPVIALIGVVTVLATVCGLILDGFSFFNEKVPHAVAFVAKRILLSDNFRGVLVQRVTKQMAYDKLCIIDHRVLDFDDDGERTDLIVEFRAPGAEGCTSYSHDIVYAMLKETGWKGVWPDYTLLTAITKSEMGYPMSFDQLGRFLVASPSGTAFPGVAVYGYANATMHHYGKFWPLGAKMKNPQAQPKAQIGNKLFLSTDEGIISFEISSSGEFVQKLLGPFDLYNRNNATVVLEDNPSEPKPEPGRDYRKVDSHLAECSRDVFLNGVAIVFEHLVKDVCIGDIQVARTSMVVANVPCLYNGFLQADQFPWGWVYDATAEQHSIQCPIDGGDSEGLPYKLMVSIRPDN